MTNTIKEVILKNNCKFPKDWETTKSHINWRADERQWLKSQVIELEGLSGLQQTTLQSCQNQIAGLEETVEQLVAVVWKLELTVCHCCDQLLLPGPHCHRFYHLVMILDLTHFFKTFLTFIFF